MLTIPLAAAALPKMSADEFASFKLHIQKNGLLCPIEILYGQIIDGRSRWLAWHYKRYSDDARLVESELIAREQVAGLWSSSHGVIPPWELRGMSTAERDTYR